MNYTGIIPWSLIDGIFPVGALAGGLCALVINAVPGVSFRKHREPGNQYLSGL